MPTTLVAVSGMSPAVITETLWALAHESPPVVPDEVIVITTSKGEIDLQRDLLTKLDAWDGKSVWETLRAKLFALTKHQKNSAKLQLAIRVIDLPDSTTGLRTPALDLRTRHHHDEAANFIVQTLAPLTDAADQHVIASIAGGRKTMGALLYAAMSLLAKETDRCTHVLVSDPFDTIRGFYYPGQPPGAPLLDSILDQSSHRASKADVELADIPFVPLRNKFAELNERRTFAGLVETYSRAPRASVPAPPQVKLNEKSGVLTVEGRPMSLTGRDLLITAFLYERAINGRPHLANKDEADPHLVEFNNAWKKRHPYHQAASRMSAEGASPEDIPKALAELRKRLNKAGLAATIPYLAPVRSRIGFDIE